MRLASRARWALIGPRARARRSAHRHRGRDRCLERAGLRRPGNRDRFAVATNNLLAAEQRSRVGHHVRLSIVGVDRSRATRITPASGSRRRSSRPVPCRTRSNGRPSSTSSRLSWSAGRDEARSPRCRRCWCSRWPADVADVLVEVALGAPQGQGNRSRRAGTAGSDRHGAPHPGRARRVAAPRPERAERDLQRGRGGRGAPAGRPERASRRRRSTCGWSRRATRRARSAAPAQLGWTTFRPQCSASTSKSRSRCKTATSARSATAAIRQSISERIVSPTARH